MYIIVVDDQDKFTLIKKTMYELYEDIQDIRFIETYISNPRKSGRKFITGDELLY